MAGYTYGIDIVRLPTQSNEMHNYQQPMVQSAQNLPYDNFGYPIFQNKMGAYENYKNWSDYFKKIDYFINSQPQYNFKRIPSQQYINFNQNVQYRPPQVSQFMPNPYGTNPYYHHNPSYAHVERQFNPVPMPHMSFNHAELPPQPDIQSRFQQQPEVPVQNVYAQRQFDTVPLADMSFNNSLLTPKPQVPAIIAAKNAMPVPVYQHTSQFTKQNTMPNSLNSVLNSSQLPNEANKQVNSAQVKDHSFKKPQAPAPRARRQKSAKSATMAEKNSTYIDYLGQIAANARSGYSIQNIYTSIAQQAPTSNFLTAGYGQTSSMHDFDEHLQELMTPEEELPKDEETANALIQQKLSMIEAKLKASEHAYIKAQLELHPVGIAERPRSVESANPKRSEQCRRSRLKEKLAKVSLQHRNDFVFMKNQNTPVVLENMKLMVENLERKLLEKGKSAKLLTLKAKYGIK